MKDLPVRVEGDTNIDGNLAGASTKRIQQVCLLVILIASGLTLTVDALGMLLWSQQSDAQSFASIVWHSGGVHVALLGAMALACVYFSKLACKVATVNGSLVSDLADQTSLLAEKNEQLTRLKQLSENIINQVDLKKALDLALEMAVDVIGARTASIMLLDQEAGELSIAVARGLRDEVVETARVKLGEGLAGLVALEGKAKVIDSEHLDDQLAPLARRTHEIRSAIIAPIKINGAVRGVINVSDKRGEQKWDEEDISVVSTLAGQAAMVLQKIELYDNLQRQVAMLEETLKQLKQTQAELVQSEKLASIGQIAGGVAHEINNPLLVILGRAEFAMDRLPEDSPAMKDLEIIHSQTERIAEIVRSLLNFSRTSDAKDFRKVDLNSMIEQTLVLTELQTAGSEIVVMRSLDLDLPQIWGNPGQLQQIFLNISINSIQAMKKTGGTLTVSTWHNDKWVFVRFRDTGPGIAPENMENIFEPFFTTKDEMEGTGLGLAIGSKLVHSHGGRIEAESEEGRGAVFTIDLPVMDAKSEQLGETDSEPEHDNGCGRRETDTRAVS